MASSVKAEEAVTTAKANLPGAFDRHDPPEMEKLLDCVHCGFCLPTCPTYLVLGNEMDSPRGRIYLMRSAAEGRVGISDSFVEHMTQYIMKALEAGPFGWQVTDCTVTMTECGFYASDGPTKPSGGTTRTVAADFRKLTPFVLRRALEQAKTVVCEPMIRTSIEAPSDSLGAVLAAVARLGGAIESLSQRGDLAMVETVMPAARLQDLQRQLPGLTGGEAAVGTSFDGYAPVGGTPPRRRRTTSNPHARPMMDPL